MRPLRPTRRELGDAGERLVVVAGLAVFVVSVYAAVVLGGGALVGQADSPPLALSVLATAVVALAFEPVQRRLEVLAPRAGRAGWSPYDVLRRFSATATGGPAGEDVPLRMARLLAEGVAASQVQVWLTVQDGLVLAATWPPDPQRLAPDGPDDDSWREVTVRYGGRVYGLLRLQQEVELTSVEERLVDGLASQSGLVLRLIALRVELATRHDELVLRGDELRRSRDRLIQTQDAERQRLERDLHDGAQQHLVALAVNLRLAQTVAVRSPARSAAILADQAGAASAAMQSLAELSRGIYPAQLADEGLVPALRVALTRTAATVRLDADGVRRLPADVEAALYFVVMEAVQNAVKHAASTTIVVRLTTADGVCTASVTDDGVGFDPRKARRDGLGVGLGSMADRVDAVGGRLDLVPGQGSGATVLATVPTSPELAAAAPVPTPRSGG